MNYFKPFLMFACLFTFSILSIHAQHIINGDFKSCHADCKIYNVSGGLGGPYYWKSTGEIEGTNQGLTVEICWNTIGQNEITVVDFSAPIASQIQKADVEVVAIPSPKIITPVYPTCSRNDTLGNPGGGTGEQDFQEVVCISACSESIAYYGFEGNKGNSVFWEVDGGTIISNSAQGIAVQWNPSGNGFIKLTESNSAGCIDSTIYCVDILDPLGVQLLAFNGGTNSINVCAEQEVYLQAIGSQEATNFEWNFGNGTYDYGENTSVSYSQGGTYDVMLIGSSECKCFDTTFYQIIVEENPGPEITCTGTTCGNEDHTYYAANTCGTYTWNISGNGIIIDGGGSSDNFISINWANGPVGTVGLSTSGCSEAVCANETIVQIPILDGTAAIEGPTVVCKEGFSNYSIQYYNGTEYTWNISGNGNIIGGWGTNEITVEWEDESFAPNESIISVSYENCYLECTGQANLNIELNPAFGISIPDLICNEDNAYFYGVDGWDLAMVSWTIISPSGAVTNYPSAGYFDESFSEIGIYTIIATDDIGTYCNDVETGFFEVIASPLPPIEIEGPMVICKNEYYNYSVPLPGPGISLIWDIHDGSSWKQYKTNTVSVQWTSNGPYRIRVTYQLDRAFCRSDEFEVFLDLAATSTISGSDKSCVDEVETYNIGATNGTTPEWSIIPPNAGSIIHNPDNSIDVMWHIDGNHQIISDYCGANLIYNVDVAPLGNNTITYTEEICPGELSPIISTIPPGSNIVIIDDQDNIVGTTINENIPEGQYIVEITSSDGCVEVIPVVIDTFLPPKVRVSSPDENAFCLPHPNVSIAALNTKDGYTYEWFHNNVSLGITTPTISTNQYGGYHVLVTDKNGCTAVSNVHRLYEWCDGDPPPGTCSGGGGGTINPDELYLNCDNLQFTVSGAGMSSTSFSWQFGDPDSGDDNISNEPSPIHEFSSAGYFYVFVQGNVAGEEGVDIFTIPASPRFDYEKACAENAVQFRNHTTFIPGFNITDYTWDFGDPSSGADNVSNDENPVHIFEDPGTYTVTLSIESNNGCLSSFELDVLVEEGPFAEFLLPSSACSNDGVFFEAFPDPDIINYEWEFNDPASGISNTSNNPNAIHTFSSNGIYNVTLSVTNENGCIQSISKPIEVANTALSGDIAADKATPICVGEEITLTAPSGGDAYVWSDGSIGQSITVIEPGVYYVTISDNTGCDYVPEPMNVIVEGLIEVRVKASIYEDQAYWVSYFDSLEICQGERFTLSTRFVSGATYEWSNANTNSYIYEDELAGLPAGRHDFNVTVTDPNSGCVIESNPLTVIVHALPDPVQLSSSTLNPCEGEEHTLTIDNPDPNLLYSWSNGGTGYSTTVSKSGSYSVSAKNKNGCEISSSSISVSAVPNANRINIGCMEACFPDTICIPSIGGAAGYQWLYNGSPMTGANGNSSDLIAEQAGDYQLIVSNWNGCLDTSNVLTIDAEPSDQSVSGVVFIDNNNNGIYDAGDELLSGVTINLFSGNVLASSITTDGLGYYIFDPINISNPRIEIDTSGLGLNLTGGLFEDDIEFIYCLEDKEKDFPLSRECLASNETLTLFTCKNETITVNNIVLQEGDTWTFEDSNVAGCDSSTYINVNAFPEADVILTPLESCQDVNNGMLDITIMTGTGLEFAIDNTSNFTTNLQFTGLAPGTHTLWMTDENNCMKSYSFVIEVVQKPEMFTVAQNTCINANTGSAEIIPSTPGNYQFSLDGITFSANNIFTGLATGTYTIYVQDDNLCLYEFPFTIAENPEPQFNLVTGKSCTNGFGGTLDIMPISSGTYTYSFNNATYSSQTNYENLPIGSYLLYVQALDGCTHIYPFTIEPKVEPQIDITAVSTCEGSNVGSIIITPNTSGNYEFSLDGISYSSDLEFSGLGEGAYIVYLLEDSICQFQYPVVINPDPTPNVFFETEDACIGEQNGSVVINSTDIGLEFSMDNINYTSNNTFGNLASGIHTIYILGDNNCVHPFDIEIFEATNLIVEFPDPILDCSVQSVQLAPRIQASFGNLSYFWNTGDADSSLLVTNTGEYELTVNDKCSSASHNWDIQFEDSSSEQPIYFPNIFSPNQDGINECFVPSLNPKTTVLNYKLMIFDRWGNKHFETNDISNCWDGKYNGKDVRTGVFVYLLEMEYTSCVEVESLKKYGDVTVVY